MRLSTSFGLVPLHCPHRLSFTMHLSFYVNNLMFLSVEKEQTKLKVYDLRKNICQRETTIFLNLCEPQAELFKKYMT